MLEVAFVNASIMIGDYAFAMGLAVPTWALVDGLVICNAPSLSVKFSFKKLASADLGSFSLITIAIELPLSKVSIFFIAISNV